MTTETRGVLETAILAPSMAAFRSEKRIEMVQQRSVEIVEEFWAAVWKARDPEAIDRFVADDFVLTAGGIDLVSRAAFKEWVRQFLTTITDFEFEVVETFQNESGSRVASRWRVTGKNNGVLGTRADQQPIAFTGTAVWAVREDGKLLHNWVERSWWELAQKLRFAADQASESHVSRHARDHRLRRQTHDRFRDK